ncbi:MAG: HAMP domain-containing protein, partial [Chloroflexota bacterium]|nr:HAMP domain-containing protein [Chloroflexota bacterium]
MNTKLLSALALFAVLPLIAISLAGYYFSRQALGSGPAADAAAERILVVYVVFLVVALLAILAAGVVVGRALTKPVLETAKVAERLGQGDFSETLKPGTGQDELQMLISAINQMIAYVREISAAADRVSAGDLTVAVRPRSEGDVLGETFARMLSSIHQLAGGMAADSRSMADAAGALLQASEQARESAQHIASSMEAVAQGTAEGSQRIASIAHGAEEQRRAVLATSDTISQMSLAIEQVAVNAQAVAATSDS